MLIVDTRLHQLPEGSSPPACLENSSAGSLVGPSIWKRSFHLRSSHLEKGRWRARLLCHILEQLWADHDVAILLVLAGEELELARHQHVALATALGLLASIASAVCLLLGRLGILPLDELRFSQQLLQTGNVGEVELVVGPRHLKNFKRHSMDVDSPTAGLKLGEIDKSAKIFLPFISFRLLLSIFLLWLKAICVIFSTDSKLTSNKGFS